MKKALIKPLLYSATKHKQKGLTVLELTVGLVVLAIVLAVIAPILYNMQKNAEGSSGAKATAGLINDIHIKWRRPPYAGVNNTWAVNAGVIDAAAVNYWGQPYTFAANRVTGGVANGAFSITEDVPQDSCLTFVNEIAMQVDELYVDGTLVKAVGANLNQATAATECNQTTAYVTIQVRDV